MRDHAKDSKRPKRKNGQCAPHQFDFKVYPLGTKEYPGEPVLFFIKDGKQGLHPIWSKGFALKVVRSLVNLPCGGSMDFHDALALETRVKAVELPQEPTLADTLFARMLEAEEDGGFSRLAEALEKNLPALRAEFAEIVGTRIEQLEEELLGAKNDLNAVTSQRDAVVKANADLRATNIVLKAEIDALNTSPDDPSAVSA